MSRSKKDINMQVSLVVAVGSLFILFFLGLFLGVYISPSYQQNSEGGVLATQDNQNKIKIEDIYNDNLQLMRADGESTFASIGVPAVDEEGNGVVTMLNVQVSAKGSGRVLTDIDKLFFWVDTQNSIRTATKVAHDVTKNDLSKYDIVYTVRANASVIEGGSAGASLTIATISALENKTLNKSVMMTGTINNDGTIGPIGEVFAKAVAAKDVGAKLFLVPEGQGSTRVYRPEKNCYKEGYLEICETKTKSEKIFISKDVGIEVKEVKTIQDAVKYFLST